MISFQEYKFIFFIIGFGVGSVYWFCFCFFGYLILKLLKGLKK